MMLAFGICKHYPNVIASMEAVLVEEISGRAKGGIARAAALSKRERHTIASAAARARWNKTPDPAQEDDDVEIIAPDTDEFEGPIEGLPVAKYKGELNLLDMAVPCYVLSNGQRVIGRTSMTELLTGIRGGGGLEKYLDVRSLKPLISIESVIERMVPFRLPEVEGLERSVKGLPADLAIDICRAFISALENSLRPSGIPMSSRRMQMALQASAFLGACAKIGLEALIDEATGFQYDRAQDALQVKLKAYLEDEMRKWEKTFPDELWIEFGRLTGWKGTVSQRPKYWGRLVMELVYEYLDADVAQWLKENAPAPRHGQNYHQWLSSQYGLKKLVEHIWMLIGVARTCGSMTELRDRMAELNGKMPMQYRFYLPTPGIAGPTTTK
jgi:hypothetical protein